MSLQHNVDFIKPSQKINRLRGAIIFYHLTGLKRPTVNDMTYIEDILYHIQDQVEELERVVESRTGR